jgi:hypothetical protein
MKKIIYKIQFKLIEISWINRRKVKKFTLYSCYNKKIDNVIQKKRVGE